MELPSAATYVNDALGHYSYIDYVLTSNMEELCSFKVLDPDLNFSDHLPIMITVDCVVTNNADSCRQPNSMHVTQYRWDKADKVGYYEFTGYKLAALLETVNSINISCCNITHSVVDDIYNQVVTVLNEGSKIFVPEHRKNFYKFWWDESLDILKQASIISNRVWKAAGKPRSGPIFEERKSCRREYRARRRQSERESELVYTNELHEALMGKNGPVFWKIWKSKFESQQKSTEVDGETNEIIVADKFADFFKNCYTCNDPTRATALAREYDVMREGYCGLPMPESCNFDVELVSKVVLDLKCGKAPGIDGLSAEHILYAHPTVVIVLSKLFALIAEYCFVPDGFRYNYIVPLPKTTGQSKKLTCNDFRGIAIAPVISKIFELCILKRFAAYFVSNDNQFGFKKGLGCNHAIYSIRKIVENMINGGSTANLCSIDLSKAFDKVNHNALFIKLMQRLLPVKLLQLIENLLSDCFSAVKWFGTFSEYFHVGFGVRQGSVLSPFLFAIYVNDVASGCKLGLNIAVILYADDILLIAQSVTMLQTLLNRCEKELIWLDMTINVNKSCCIRIGKRYDATCANITTLSGLPLTWMREFRYLGTHIVSALTFKCSTSVCKRSFFKAANAIFGRVGTTASEEVFLHLLTSKCMPVLLYGLECFSLSKSEVNSLDFACRRVLMKLFKTSNIDIINYCIDMFDISLPSVMLETRVRRFVKKYSGSRNGLCQLLS